MTPSQLQLDDGRTLPIDDRGYLLDYACWSPEVAEAMAARDGIELGDDHWLVLGIFREYYESYEIEPPMRALVKRTRERLQQPLPVRAVPRWPRHPGRPLRWPAPAAFLRVGAT
jgi:tRNA 2-thiouridine synthesizing protein E